MANLDGSIIFDENEQDSKVAGLELEGSVRDEGNQTWHSSFMGNSRTDLSTAHGSATDPANLPSEALSIPSLPLSDTNSSTQTFEVTQKSLDHFDDPKRSNDDPFQRSGEIKYERPKDFLSSPAQSKRNWASRRFSVEQEFSGGAAPLLEGSSDREGRWAVRAREQIVPKTLIRPVEETPIPSPLPSQSLTVGTNRQTPDIVRDSGHLKGDPVQRYGEVRYDRPSSFVSSPSQGTQTAISRSWTPRKNYSGKELADNIPSLPKLAPPLELPSNREEQQTFQLEDPSAMKISDQAQSRAVTRSSAAQLKAIRKNWMQNAADLPPAFRSTMIKRNTIPRSNSMGGKSSSKANDDSSTMNSSFHSVPNDELRRPEGLPDRFAATPTSSIRSSSKLQSRTGLAPAEFKNSDKRASSLNQLDDLSSMNETGRMSEGFEELISDDLPSSGVFPKGKSTGLAISFVSLEQLDLSDIQSYNNFLRGVVNSELPDKAQRALNVLATMKRNDVEPDRSTWDWIEKCSDVAYGRDKEGLSQHVSESMIRVKKLSLYSEVEGGAFETVGDSERQRKTWKMDQDLSQLPPAFRSSLLYMLAKKNQRVEEAEKLTTGKSSRSNFQFERGNLAAHIPKCPTSK